MNIKQILIICIGLLSITSCNKYESGPAISFTSRTNRLVNSWTYAEVYRNGLIVTDGIDTSGQNFLSSSIGFATDGRFSFNDVFIDDPTIIGDGFWAFTDEDAKLELIYDEPINETRTFFITRLERRFLWLEEELPNNTTMEYRLVPNN